MRFVVFRYAQEPLIICVADLSNVTVYYLSKKNGWMNTMTGLVHPVTNPEFNFGSFRNGIRKLKEIVPEIKNVKGDFRHGTTHMVFETK